MSASHAEEHMEEGSSQKSSSTTWHGGAWLQSERVGGSKFKVCLGYLVTVLSQLGSETLYPDQQ